MPPTSSGDARGLVGQQLGVYQIEAMLAVGGQTDFFCARDLYTDQLVALKLLPATLSTSREAVTRLRDEMRRIARLRHPHLLPVVEVATERGLLFAIALLPTDSLRTRFERFGLLPPQDAVRYAAELAWALHALHSAGLVHGDVQPANMLFDTQAGLRLADFGIPRAIQRQQGKERHSAPSRPLVSARSYTAPEVAQGGEITPRSDIYSLGAVFYEMLIGTLPLVAPDGSPENEEITTAPLPPSMRSSEDWPELAAVALKALAPDPVRRYADARAFAVALRTAVFTQQREDTRPSLIAALSGVFHAPVEGPDEAAFIRRVTGAPVPSAPIPDAPSPASPHAGPLDPRHLAYRAAPPPVPTPPPATPPPSDPFFAAPPPDPEPLSEDDIATTLLDERLRPHDAEPSAMPPYTLPASPWIEDDIATTLLDRDRLDLNAAMDEPAPPVPIGMPLPPPSVPPRTSPYPIGSGGDEDLASAWLAALESTAGAASPAVADDSTTTSEPDDDQHEPAPVQPDELVEDLRRLAGGASRPVGRRSRSNPGWVKALLATLGITALAAASGFGILATTHAPNPAPGGPAIPTATTAPAATVSAATLGPTPHSAQPGDSHGSTYTFPTPTPIPPLPTATP